MSQAQIVDASQSLPWDDLPQAAHQASGKNTLPWEDMPAPAHAQKVFDLVGTASTFAIDGQRARSVAEEAAVNGVSYDAADRDLDYMRTAVSHERTVSAVEQQATAIDKYLPRTQKLMTSHGPALVSAAWNDMQSATGFERVLLESKLAHEMGQISMDQQLINLKRFYGLDDAGDRAQLLDIERKVGKYGEYRKDEGFFSGSLRGMFQTFVPQVLAGGTKALTRGLQSGAAAGFASAAFGPAAVPTAGAAFGVGATTGAVEYAFEQSLAEIYGSLADMKDAHGKPLDQGAARVLAVVGGAGMAALEMVGLKYAVNLMPGLSRVLTGSAVQSALHTVEGSPAIAKAVGESGIRLLKSLAAESGTEAAQEAIVIGAESAATSIARSQGRKADHISTDDAIERVVESGVEAAKAFFFPSLGGASIGGLGAYRAAGRKAQHAQVDRDNIATIASAVQQSSLVAESPTVAQNAIRFATDGKPLYIAPQSLTELFQSEQGQEIAKSMGISADQVADAIDLGTDVAVPIHKQTALMRSEFWQNIEPHTRLTPNGVTQEQSVALAEGKADITGEALGDFMSMLSEVDQQAQRKDNWRQWTEKYRFELEESGYTKLQADSFGDVLASHAEVFAPMFGQSPSEYLEQRLVKIEQVTPATYTKNKVRFLQGLEWNTLEERLQAEQEKVHITKKSPLMATLWGQASAESVKAMVGKDGYKELVQRYGRSMFAKRGKGVAWDVAVQSAIRQGLLPETANPSDVADALVGSKVLYQDGEASLRQDAAAWGVQVERIATSGKVPSSPVHMLTQTPLVMQMLGAKERPVYAAPHLFDGTHPNITPDMLKGLPQALVDPIAIFQSKTHQDRLVFMLEMTDAKGATVVVPVHLDGTMDRTTIHIAITVYAKERKGNPDNAWFEKQAGNALYVNRQKEKRWIMSSGSNSLWDASSVSSNVNIRTEADLVNLRQQNPSMYAGDKKSPRGSISFRPQDNAAMISIFKGKGDISTIVHEGAGHLFLENLREAAQQQGTPAWVMQTWATIASDIGADLDPAANISIDAHEKFAATAVEFFRRGKAPSQELHTVFRMFGRWLNGIYRQVRRMLDFRDVSPEVDAAMARLIATEEDIAKAEKTLEVPQEAPEGADVNKWAEYLKLQVAARTDAEAAIALRRLDEEQRVTKEARLEAKILMTSDKHMLDIARLKQMGGISLADITESFGEETAWTIRERWQGGGKRLLKQAGTVTIDDVMQELDFTEPQQALAWLLDAQTEKDFTSAIVAERLAEWEAAYSPESEAVATASADAALKMRDEALSGAPQVGTNSLLRELERRMQDMPLDAVNGEFNALQAAERRRAAAKNLAAEVIGAERKRRAAMGTAYRVRMEREKLKGQVRRIASFKTALDPFYQQILALVSRYNGLGTKSMRPRGEIPSLQDFYKEWALNNGMDESQAPSMPQWMIDHMAKRADMRLGDLTIEQLRELHGMIKQLHHMGRTAGALVGALHKADVQNTVAALTATMDRLPETQHIDEIARNSLIGKARIFLRNSYASKAIMRYVFKMADGYVSHGDSLKTGANERLLHRPLADAANMELGLRKEYSRLLREALAPLAGMKDIEKPFSINGVSLSEDVAKDWRNMWTMEKVFALALNMGNEGNRNAIMRGYGLTEEEIGLVLQRMTPELWHSVQKVWDALEGLYPRLNKVHEALYGVPMSKVEHTPFEVQHGDGAIHMRGGYYPLIFDRKFSKKAAANEDFDNALNSHEAIIRKPNPKSGFTKERQGGTLPPLLSLDVVSRHITDSIHYAAFTLPLRDAYVLTNDAKYEKSFVRAFGQELHKELLPWLRSIARPEPKLKSQGDKIINWMAARGTLTTLGFSFRTAAMGFTSTPNSIHRVGFVPFVKAAAHCAVHPFKTWRMIAELSNYMDNRAAIMDRDMRAYLDSMFKRADFINMGPLRVSRKQFEKAAFAMIVAVDSVVAAPTWLAQHERALEAGKSMDEAVQAADDAVFEAQAGGSVVDMSAMMRDPGMMRLLTVFMTFTSNQYNKTAYYWRGLKTSIRTGELASDIALADFSKYMALEIVTSSALIALLFAAGQEGETPEAKDIVWEIIGTLLGGNPLLRMIPSAMRYGTKAGETAGMRGIQSVGDVLRISAGMAGGEITTLQRRKKFMRSAINAAGFAAGVPTLQLWRTVDGIEAFNKGIGGPLTPIFGPPPKRKKKGLL